jgi:hypothetical protein
MKTTIRLTAALIAALAFTTAWAAGSKCEANDTACLEKEAQASSQDSMSAGSGAPEPSTSDAKWDEISQERLQQETWVSGD